MHSGARWSAAAVGSVVVLVLGAGGSSASTEPRVAGSPDVIAASGGSAPDGDNWQGAANLAVDELRAEFPADFAYAELGDADVEVGFRGLVPDSVSRVLGKLGVAHHEVGGLGYSEQELVAESKVVHQEVLAAVGSDIDVSTGPVPGEPRIQVTLTSSVPAETAEAKFRSDGMTSPSVGLEDAQARVRETVRSTTARGGFAVEVLVSQGEPAQDEGYGQAGGTRLDYTSGGLACTSAFVVKSLSGPDLGVLTAGHCPNSLQQISVNGNFDFDFRSEHRGSSGDIQWMRSPVMMDPWFHYDHGLGRPVRAVGTASVGTNICMYGVVSGRSCGQVAYTDMQLTVDGVTSHDLSVASGITSTGGDSGGPYYYNYTAYGIHKGTASLGKYFTPVTRATALWNLKVCIEAGC